MNILVAVTMFEFEAEALHVPDTGTFALTYIVQDSGLDVVNCVGRVIDKYPVLLRGFWSESENVYVVVLLMTGLAILSVDESVRVPGTA